MSEEDGPEPSSWFAYISARPAGVASWLLPRRDSAKKVARLLTAVSASWQDDAPLADLAANFGADGSPPAAPCPPLAPRLRAGTVGLARQPSGGAPLQSFVFNCGGLTVKQGVHEVAAGLFRVEPFVHCSPGNDAAVAFSGHLSNLQELAARYLSPGRPDGPAAHTPPAARRGGGVAAGGGGGGLAQRSLLGNSPDIGALTAAVVLAMYRAEEELVLLSELQGQFAFIVIDDTRRQAFAARDPSGSESLWFRIGDDGSAAFASSASAIPETATDCDDDGGDWRELPPGHCVSGKDHRLHQYALTQEQLQVREMCQATIPTSKLRAAPARAAGAAVAMSTPAVLRRGSLDYAAARQPRSLEDLDLFGFGAD